MRRVVAAAAVLVLTGCGNATVPVLGPPPAARAVATTTPSTTASAPTSPAAPTSPVAPSPEPAATTASAPAATASRELVPDDLGLVTGVPWAMTYPPGTRAADITLSQQGSSYLLEGVPPAQLLAYYRAHLDRSFVIDSDLTANSVTTIRFHNAGHWSTLTCGEWTCRVQHHQR